MPDLEVLIAALEKHSDHLSSNEFNSSGGDYVIVGELTVTDVIMSLIEGIRKQ